jgi:subtilisin
MNQSFARLARGVLITVLLALLIPVAVPAEPSPKRVIVTFARGSETTGKARVRSLGVSENANLPLVHGAAMTLPAGVSMNEVRRLPGVTRVEEDVVVTALARKVTQPVQKLPWGVDRVEADLVWPVTTGDPVKVAVVDTGIDTSHPDLSANVKGGYSAVSYTRSFSDDNGHGTHVAGTIAAANNTIGVVGVAPNADLYAVKVLDKNGSGYVSDIIKGIQWSVSNGVNVINMSLGSSTYSLAFDTACQQAIASGVTIVAAAGNSGPSLGTVGYPAKFAGVIGVSATDSSNVIASFSSRGDGVDIAAPGVSIYSTYRGSTYATLSGTSMASPHVAGVVALVLTTPVGSDDLDADGSWDPAEVQNRLTRTATDLGTAGYDTSYGWGMARADRAVAAR